MRTAICGKCQAPGLEWAESPLGVLYLRDRLTGHEHWRVCAGVAVDVRELAAVPAPAANGHAPAPVIVAAPAPVAVDELEAIGAELDEAEAMREAMHGEQLRACDWPELRRAILAYGGIGPSPDFPRDWYPADLYRVNGKAPDLVAAEAVRNAPWGDTGDDTAMLGYLHRSWEQWQAAQLDRRPAARQIKPPAKTGSARKVSDALAAPAPADLRAAVLSMARLVADVADLVAAGKAPADLPRQIAAAARTLAEAT